LTVGIDVLPLDGQYYSVQQGFLSSL
jgi:hypothetical protein